jgi:hypothetical protein
MMTGIMLTGARQGGGNLTPSTAVDIVAQEKSGSDVAEDNSSRQLDVKTNNLGKDAATSIPEEKDETRDATATTLNEEDGKEATTETSKAAAVESSPPEEAGEPEEGSEAFKMRAAAESIMNVLDVTMPGTLSNEKKQQVIAFPTIAAGLQSICV